MNCLAKNFHLSSPWTAKFSLTSFFSLYSFYLPTDLLSTSLRNSSRLIFPSSACREQNIISYLFCKKYFDCSGRKFYDSFARKVDDASLGEKLMMLLQDISGFEIFFPQLQLAFSLLTCLLPTKTDFTVNKALALEKF